MMKPTTDTEVKAENEKASEAKNNDDINTQKVDTKDPNEQQDKATEINVHVKTKKECDTEETSPSSPGYNSATSGSNLAEDQVSLGNLNKVVLDEKKKKGKEENKAVIHADIKPAKEKVYNNSEDTCRAIAIEVIESAIETTRDKEEEDAAVAAAAAIDVVLDKVMECATEKKTNFDVLIL